jgi:hypothetical protein
MTFQTNPEKPSGYIAYLVRLWRDGQAGQWRASAQSVQTGEKVLFASLAELLVFLEGQTLADPADNLEGPVPPDT